MNEKKVTKILEKKIADLSKAAKKGRTHQGVITGTMIVVGCSPGKMNFTYPQKPDCAFVTKLLKENGFRKGRHDKKIMQGQKIRALTKIVDEKMEREFNISEYGEYKP